MLVAGLASCFLSKLVSMSDGNRWILVVAIGLALVSCKPEGCTDPAALNYRASAEKDDGSCLYPEDLGQQNITFSITPLYQGQPVATGDLGTVWYTNAAGNEHSINRCRFLLSEFVFYNENHDSVIVPQFELIDLTDPGSLTFQMAETVHEQYNRFSFVLGFYPQFNLTGEYSLLNTANWNWPESLGGGYHFVQFDGQFKTAGGDTAGFNYHMGRARLIEGGDTTFVNNHRRYMFEQPSIVNAPERRIRIAVSLDQWLELPHVWDFNQYSQSLMGNFEAQRMMNDNSVSVFAFQNVEAMQ